MALALVPELLAVFFFVALIWIAIFAALRNERLQAEQDAFHQSSSLSHAYADNAQRVVGGIDQMLLALRSRFADNPAGFDLTAWAQLQNPSDRLRVQVAIINANGLLSDSTAPGKLQRVDLSDWEHFRAQLDAARDDLFISRPVLGRLTGLQTVQFSRKLLRRDGTFASVAVVSIGCDELSRFYSPVVQRQRSAAFQRDLELTLESMSQGIVMIGPDGRIPVMNRRAAELLAVDASVVDACKGRFATEFAQVIPAEAMREGTIHRGDRVVEVQSRQTLYGGRVLTYSDVTERAQHVEQRAKVARFRGQTASNSFHPGPCDHPAFALEDLGCCSWI